MSLSERASNHRRSGCVLLVVAALAGCITGGQSGTEGAAVPSCVCDRLDVSVPVLGEIVAVDGDHYTLRVDALVVETDLEPEPGREVGGTWLAQPPCGDGIEVVVGDPVLALYTRGSQDGIDCVEYQGCSEERCGPFPEDGDPTSSEMEAWDVCDTQCLEETRDACAAHEEEAWLGGHVVLAARDADGWVFGSDEEGPLRMGEDETALLTDVGACNERFPPEPTCDMYANGEPACD